MPDKVQSNIDLSLAVINFKYKAGFLSVFTGVDFLRASKNQDSENLLNLAVYATSKSKIEKMGGQVIDELQEFFKARMDKLVEEYTSRITFILEKKKLLELELAEIENKKKILGYNMNLENLRSSIVQKKELLDQELFTQRQKMSNNSFSNIVVIDSKVVSSGPVFPDRRVFAFVGAVFALLIMLLYYFIGILQVNIVNNETDS